LKRDYKLWGLRVKSKNFKNTEAQKNSILIKKMCKVELHTLLATEKTLTTNNN